MSEVIDTVIVGAGHAGLALSCYLTRNGTEHIVLERGNVAERWRTERWDSLVFQFPNWSLQLPGRAYQGTDPDGYASKDEFIRFLEDYASIIRAPVRCDTEVVGLREAESRRSMILETTRGVIEAKNVVVATGPFQAPKIPALSRDLPRDLFQIPGDEAAALYELGAIRTHVSTPDVAQAGARFQEALTLADELRMRPLVAHCHLGLGKLYRRTEKPEQAHEHLTTALSMYREMDMRFYLKQAEAERGALA